MVQAAGIVTATGGMVSHAALVARGWGSAAVCGVEALQFDPDLTIAGMPLLDGGARLTIDGTAGKIYFGDCVEAGQGEPVEVAVTLRRWAAEAGLQLGGERDGASGAGPVALAATRCCRAGRVRHGRTGAGIARLRVGRTPCSRAGDSRLEAVRQDPRDDCRKSSASARHREALHVMPEGRAWLSGWLKAERESVDRGMAERLYQNFMALDARSGQLVTELADPDDPRRQESPERPRRCCPYDAGIRAQLAEDFTGRLPCCCAHYPPPLSRQPG